MIERKNLAPKVAALWEQLDRAEGKKYWRTLDELADVVVSLNARQFIRPWSGAISGLRRRLRLTPSSSHDGPGGEHGHDESPLHGRNHVDDDGGQGRSSARGEGKRNGSDCLDAGRRIAELQRNRTA